jgi:hypothetical protein
MLYNNRKRNIVVFNLYEIYKAGFYLAAKNLDIFGINGSLAAGLDYNSKF